MHLDVERAAVAHIPLRFICGFCHAEMWMLTELVEHVCPERDSFLAALRESEELCERE